MAVIFHRRRFLCSLFLSSVIFLLFNWYFIVISIVVLNNSTRSNELHVFNRNMEPDLNSEEESEHSNNNIPMITLTPETTLPIKNVNMIKKPELRSMIEALLQKQQLQKPKPLLQKQQETKQLKKNMNVTAISHSENVSYSLENDYQYVPTMRPIDIYDIYYEYLAWQNQNKGNDETDPERSVNFIRTETSNSSLNDPSLKSESDVHGISIDEMLSNQQSVTKNKALIIDTSGCKIPKLDPWDSSVMRLIEPYTSLICSDKPLFMKPEPNGIVHLNATVLETYYNATLDDIQCWYQAIVRKYEKPGYIRENNYVTTSVSLMTFDKPMDYEYIAVKCFFSNNSTFEQYMPLVKIKDKVEDERSKIKPPTPLNVILLGIDSVSKLNFLRHFNKTKSFLEENMKAFEMKGYTKVGDNTFPNLVPLLTGNFVDYYWNESMRHTFFFDNISLIWKDYARNGYRTFYAEDGPYTGTFNYLKKGFHDPPTDYYYRPLAMAIQNLRLKQNLTESDPCLNSETETDLMFDYLKNFIKTMDTRPYFAFCMVSILTHDLLNSASHADLPTTRILQALQDEGALNTSALVIFSDHGLRYGEIRETYIGKFEERMPFMYMHFPKWFLDQHPGFKLNLKTNQERLMTLFDVHATMKHLLHVNEEPIEKSDALGLSLFNEIPENRTCKDAHILQHFCPCNNFVNVSIDDPVIKEVSIALIDHINEILSPYAEVCEWLSIAEIQDAQLGKADELVLRRIRQVKVENRTLMLSEAPPVIGDYLVTVTVHPGGAIFEGTVRYDAENGISKVMGVSRINMYGKTSWCINSQKLKLYCFCKEQLSLQDLLDLELKQLKLDI
ncbi:uncharacterized protein [Parasteatoda tepidariorum]|uniref:uncharacterized protein n=1 Tax=Parasteatoda tepidariorum TaxID=114398 RepID=UPI001C717BFD|nr:uncharacterized protein LOC107444432 [Parasteatoda tepidariorum]